MTGLFHVTSALNRESILAHGLDWTRMGAAPGIAGSSLPEEDGVFLCRDEFEAGFFVQMNNTGGPVEVWAVADIGEEQLITSGSGFCYFPARIPRSLFAAIAAPTPLPHTTMARSTNSGTARPSGRPGPRPSRTRTRQRPW